MTKALGSFCPDQNDLAQKLSDACVSVDTADDKKLAIAAILKAEIDEANAKVAKAFRDDPTVVWETLKRYTALAEVTVRTVVDAVSTHIHSAHIPTTSEKMSIVLVGGSGRGEMAPFSDIDLLFLTPYKKSPWVENVLESV